MSVTILIAMTTKVTKDRSIRAQREGTVCHSGRRMRQLVTGHLSPGGKEIAAGTYLLSFGQPRVPANGVSPPLINPI